MADTENPIPTSKLRNSCHECAISKVKCSKEKPTCSRCQKRSTRCEYFATKRSGRRRTTNARLITDSIAASETASPVARSPGKSTAHPGSLSGSTGCSSPEVMSPQTAGESAASFDIFSDHPMGMHVDPTPAGVGDISRDLDSFFSTGLTGVHSGLNPGLDSFDFCHDDFDISSIFLPNRDHSNMPVASNMMPIPGSIEPVLSTSTGTSTGTSFETSTSDGTTIDYQTLLGSDTDVSDKSTDCCLCLTQVFTIMKTVSTDGSKELAPPSSPLDSGRPIHIRPACHPTKSVIDDNRRMIESVSCILGCSCAEDGYILTMLSMIVVKILRRYAAVALNLLGKGEGQSAPKEVQGTERLAAQEILSELHQVQQLVQDISPRLMASDGAGEHGGRRMLLSLKLPFSAITLQKIGVDLRETLSTLTSELITMLRET
ncbi:hypothetical protein GGR56DRAFT_156287 [Xylariaceae sp. FL0804]|nr:hypothetical protein GGR56DRAFT_156287 [Xylariaceae sp. FL0804]